MNKETLEMKASTAILQEPVVVVLGGRRYRADVPTMRTLIRASRYCGELPILNVNTDKPMEEALVVAKDCEVVAPFVASLMVGTKGEYNPVVRMYKRWRMKRLVNRIIFNSTPKEVMEALLVLLPVTQPSFFLTIISFMASVNLLEQQRELKVTAAHGL